MGNSLIQISSICLMLFLLIEDSAPPCHRPPGRQTEREGGGPSPVLQPPSSYQLPGNPSTEQHPLLHPAGTGCSTHRSFPTASSESHTSISAPVNETKSVCVLEDEDASPLRAGKNAPASPRQAPRLPSGLLERSAGGWRVETGPGRAESRWRSPG